MDIPRTCQIQIWYRDWIDLNNEPIGVISIIIKIMIGMSNRHLSNINPLQKAVIISGYAETETAKKFRRWEREPLFGNLTLWKSLGMLKQTVRKSFSD